MTGPRIEVNEWEIVVQYRDGGMPIEKIAKLHGTSFGVIRRCLIQNGVRFRKRNDYRTGIDAQPDSVIEAIAAEYRSGKIDCKKLAKKHHCSWKVIRRILEDRGVEIRRPGRRPSGKHIAPQEPPPPKESEFGEV